MSSVLRVREFDSMCERVWFCVYVSLVLRVCEFDSARV